MTDIVVSVGAGFPDPSEVEGPGLSGVEGPGLSEVEGPGLSEVEGPGLSGVEGSRLDLLNHAAAVESLSEHPLAEAIVHAARERGIDISRESDFHSEPARARGVVAGRMVVVGNAAWLRECGIDPSPAQSVVERFAAEGKTVVLVSVGVRRDGPSGPSRGAAEGRDEAGPTITVSLA